MINMIYQKGGYYRVDRKQQQENNTARVCLPQLGSKAPDFTAMTTFGERSLSDYRGNWVIFFAHPGDFTPV